MTRCVSARIATGPPSAYATTAVCRCVGAIRRPRLGVWSACSATRRCTQRTRRSPWCAALVVRTRCVPSVAYRKRGKDHGGSYHCLPFVWSPGERRGDDPRADLFVGAYGALG